MVGLGETRDELLQVFRDLRTVDCDLLTIGQYLKPSAADQPRQHLHLPVERYYPPAEFDELGAAAKELGFAAVAERPFVRQQLLCGDAVRGSELPYAHGQPPAPSRKSEVFCGPGHSC